MLGRAANDALQLVAPKSPVWANGCRRRQENGRRRPTLSSDGEDGMSRLTVWIAVTAIVLGTLYVLQAHGLIRF
jgi:hypothetical protein